jgi:hypothetical protein
LHKPFDKLNNNLQIKINIKIITNISRNEIYMIYIFFKLITE